MRHDHNDIMNDYEINETKPRTNTSNDQVLRMKENNLNYNGICWE